MDSWPVRDVQIDLLPKDGVQWSSVTVKVCIVIVLYCPQNKNTVVGKGGMYPAFFLIGHSKSKTSFLLSL